MDSALLNDLDITVVNAGVVAITRVVAIDLASAITTDIEKLIALPKPLVIENTGVMIADTSLLVGRTTVNAGVVSEAINLPVECTTEKVGVVVDETILPTARSKEKVGVVREETSLLCERIREKVGVVMIDLTLFIAFDTE